MSNIMENYEKWLRADALSTEERAELEAILRRRQQEQK